MAIHFDDHNLRASMVGAEHGITDAELREAGPAAREALRSFRKAFEEGRYGFPSLPSDTTTIQAMQHYAQEQAGSYDTVCVVGIGGSALGAWALDCALHGPHPVQSKGHPRLVVLDNIDPAFLRLALDSMNPRKTLVLPIAKSGSTAETAATFLIVREWLTAALGRKAPRRIAAVTTEGKGDLYALALREGYRVFFLPENVGGRFSVLSAVGLLPAALTGLDVRKIGKGAAAMTGLCWRDDLEANIALRAAMLHHLVWTRKGKSIQVAFPYSNQLWGAAFWFPQLWAESLGKARDRAGNLVHAGQTPVAALGATDQHSQAQLYMEGPNDKVFTFWAVRRFADPGRIPRAKTGFAAFDYLTSQTLARLIEAERRATTAALTNELRPNCTFTLDRIDEEHIGGFLQLMEFETAFLGELLHIDAFDQPGVEAGKRFTFGLMRRPGAKQYRASFEEYEAKRARAGTRSPARADA